VPPQLQSRQTAGNSVRKISSLKRLVLRPLGEDGTLTDRYKGQTLDVLGAITAKFPVETWGSVTKYIGPPVNSRAFHVSRWLRDGALTFIPPGEVWNWIDGDISTRAWYAATFVPPKLERQTAETCWARELLIRYGDRQDVRKNLSANFLTGSWQGPESSHYQSKKQALEAFRNGETDINVLRWLDEFIAGLNHYIEHAQIREERGL
jgi:hypothetical protein